jgi:hypothetical protein
MQFTIGRADAEIIDSAPLDRAKGYCPTEMRLMAADSVSSPSER